MVTVVIAFAFALIAVSALMVAVTVWLAVPQIVTELRRIADALDFPCCGDGGEGEELDIPPTPPARKATSESKPRVDLPS